MTFPHPSSEPPFPFQPGQVFFWQTDYEVFKDLLRRWKKSSPAMTRPLEALLMASDRAGAVEAIQAHPILLTDEGQAGVSALIEFARMMGPVDPVALPLALQRMAVLQRCRKVGTAAALLEAKMGAPQPAPPRRDRG